MSPPYTTGWVHNLEHAPAQSDASSVIALAASFSIITILFTILRLSVRYKAVGGWGLDDAAIAASALLGVAYSAIAAYQTRWGLGLDPQTFPLENAIAFSRVQYAGGPVYCLAVLGFKVSLLAGYLRVAGFNRIYAVILYVALGLVIVSQLVFTFLLSFACSPIAKQWDPDIPGTCINTLPTYFALGGTSLACDVLIIILPFPILRRLQLDKRNKISLAILFGAGFFVTIVQGIQIQTISALVTYTDSKAIIQWSIIEIGMGVIVACMPAFSPLLKSFSKTTLSHSQSRSANCRGIAYGPSQKDGSARGPRTPRGFRTPRGSRTPARKSRVFDLIRDDDEMELCETEKGWVGGSHVWDTANTGPTSTHMRTAGVADDADYDVWWRTCSPCGPQQQRNTAVHEYTVHHADAKGL